MYGKIEMRILVTGGAGFIGSHLVDALIDEGHDIIVLDNLSTGKKEQINEKAKFHNVDIRNYESIKSLFSGVDYVFHLAAQARIQPSIANPKETFENNVTGTLNVLLASKESKVKKVIYSASSSAYGDQPIIPLKEDMETRPKTPYSLSKIIGEQLCKLFYKLYGLNTLSLRYFNVYGPRQPSNKIASPYATVIGIFLHQKKEGGKLTIISDGEQRRDFTYVSDVVNANILAMNSKAGNGEIINIGTGKNYSINEIAFLVTGKDYKKHVQYLSERPGEVDKTLADISKAKKLLAWEPKIDITEGLKLCENFD